MSTKMIAIPEALLDSILEEFQTDRDGHENKGLAEIVYAMKNIAPTVGNAVCPLCNGAGEVPASFGDRMVLCRVCRGQERKFEAIMKAEIEEERRRNRLLTHGCSGMDNISEDECSMCRERQAGLLRRELGTEAVGQVMSKELTQKLKSQIAQYKWLCPTKAPVFDIRQDENDPNALILYYEKGLKNDQDRTLKCPFTDELARDLETYHGI